MKTTATAKGRSKTAASAGKRRPGAEQGCRVVALGASAGGLASFEKFFRAADAGSGLAYVLISHMDPSKQSLLAELIAKYTTMPVITAAEGMPALADHVYVCPPDKGLEMHGGELRLIGPEGRAGPRTVIDHFMRSLAEDQQEKAIGIILSGTGSDGSLGLAAIKDAGGLTMAESPETAQHNGMPLGAIRIRAADVVLPPQEMPAHLLRYARQAGELRLVGVAAEDVRNADQLNAILGILRSRTRHDFRPYKTGTILRRIARRMGLLHIEKMPAYVSFLRKHPAEVTKLFDDLLIGATRFFREPEAYQALEDKAITRLLREKKEDEPLRVWVAACATGEEAYSMAMLLTERLQAAEQHRKLQIFATDIDEAALVFARGALYPDSIAADVSPERLRRWFVKEGHSYRVSKAIRESVVFATQNLIKDPPFSKLDLVSCRNLLIYLEPEAQKRAIELFHFALREGGTLLLGNSETIGQGNELFTPVSKKWRIYQRASAPRHGHEDFSAFPRSDLAAGEARAMAALATRGQTRTQQATLADLTQAQVLRDYAPACVVINDKCRILLFFGATGMYLEQPGGVPTQDLLNMARKGLRTKLRGAVEGVLAGEASSRCTAHISREGQRQPVRAVVSTMNPSPFGETLMLVAFFDDPKVEPGEGSADSADANSELLLSQLEHELKSTRQDLQGTIEELESANEELKTANEEAMSMNEELQSSNEEMETSKEELQSMNEEMSTVNSELQLKIEEVETTNNDLSNLLAGTDMATIFLDPKCRIRRFTPASVKLFSLIATDLHRPVSDISHRFAVDDLRSAAESVIQTLAEQELEVRTTDSRWFIRRIMPYRTLDQRVNGVVITFSDITALKQIEQALHVSDKRFRALYDDNPSMYFTLDDTGVILSVNRFGAEQLGYTAEALEGSSYFALHEIGESSLRERLQTCLNEAEQVHRWEAQLKTRDGDLLWTRGTARAVTLAPGKSSVFIACENIVEEKKHYTEVSYYANHDAMTGLVNRRRFEELLNRAAQTAVDSNAEHALLFLDLDQFKVVNDTAGHLAGDQMLQQIAQLLRDTVRKRDVVGRLGGDEFAVLMELCSAEEAQRLAHALLTAIKGYHFIWEGQNLWAGASIGLVAINAQSDGVAGILRSADIACYKAKEAGRGGVEIYAESNAGLQSRVS